MKEKVSGFASKRIAILGILTALSLLTFILENLLPPLFLPGAKLGLSNIFTLVTLLMFTPYDALILIAVRTTLGCLIVGNISAILYSLSAGLVSVIVTIILVQFAHPKISLLSISIVSATVHNITQVLMFCLLTSSSLMMSYIPYFALIGIFSGAVVGVIVYLLIHKVPLFYFERNLKMNIKSEKEQSC